MAEDSHKVILIVRWIDGDISIVRKNNSRARVYKVIGFMRRTCLSQAIQSKFHTTMVKDIDGNRPGIYYWFDENEYHKYIDSLQHEERW